MNTKHDISINLQLWDAAKRIEELEIALRVIYTWCNIPENDTYLIMDIQNLAKSTLRMK